MSQHGSTRPGDRREVIGPELVAELAPTGALRAAINLGNPTLAHRNEGAPAGVTVELAHELAFTDPYVIVDGVYVVRCDSPAQAAGEVDRPGMRIALNEGSAYDLFLTRTLRRAQLVRAADGIDSFLCEGLDAVAGIRQPLSRVVAGRSDLRMLEPAFMQIRQCVAAPRERSTPTLDFLGSRIAALGHDGFIAAALQRAGQDPTLAAR